MLIAWWNPFAAIGEAIISFFIGVLLFLDSIVYSLINWVYQIILVLCQIDVLNNTFEIDALINRIYIIIGVVVLFLLAYSLLKSMINPDDALKGKKSPVAIIRDVIISIVLIALIPTIFDFAMGFQTAILENNTIGKIILGSTSVIERDENGNVVEEESSSDVIREGGIAIASNVLRAFLHPNYSNCTVDETSDTGYDCSNIMIEQSAYGISGTKTFDDFWRDTVEAGSIGAITDLSDNIVDGGVTYYYIISTVAGVFVLFVLLSYCFDIALRLIKLAVYQLIAPLPILARIMPGEQGGKVFSNWLKATISTYVEVFIRLAILFFAVLLIKIVVQNFTTIFAPFVSGSDSWTVILFAQLFVIIGIILFIKQAPGMIKDITGLDGGKYNVFGSAMRGLSSIGALGTGAVRGFTTGFDKNNIPGSIGRGLKNAFAGGVKSFAGAAQKEYKGIGDIRKNTNAVVNDVINKQRKKASENLAKKQELEEWREEHPNNRNIPTFLYKAASRVHKGAHDVGTGVLDWATSGGLDALKQKREQVAEVQKAMAQTVSMAKGEVEKNLKDYVNAQGVTLDRLQIDVDYFKAQLAGVKADEVLTNKYSELQTKLLNEKDAVQQGIIRRQMEQVQSEIDRDVATKRSTVSDQLKTAQDALDKGIKDATQMIIDYTYANKNGQTVKINGQDWQVQTVAGLSAQIAKADNLLKQNSSLMPDNLPTDSSVTITGEDGRTESSRSRDYKGYRNTLGNAVDALDAEISKYVERREKKEDK